MTTTHDTTRTGPAGCSAVASRAVAGFRERSLRRVAGLNGGADARPQGCMTPPRPGSVPGFSRPVDVD